MFKFKRELILPLFLSKGMRVGVLAKQAGLSHKAAERAVNGMPITAPVVEKIARALAINPLDFLHAPAQMIKEGNYAD